jgi:hypothetical protein
MESETEKWSCKEPVGVGNLHGRCGLRSRGRRKAEYPCIFICKGVSKSFWTELIMKYTLTTINTH